MKLALLLLLVSAAVAATQCGTRLPKASGGKQRVLGGTNVTTPGKWPWMVRIEMKYETESKGSKLRSCGGTIVNERWILTAAHCMRYVEWGYHVTSDVAVVLGEITNANSSSILESLLNKHAYKVRKVHVHRRYRESTLQHSADDIALLELDEPIKFDSSVAPICLPNYNQDVPSDGQAVVTGFGLANNRKTFELVRDDQLRETTVPIVEDGFCEELWRKRNFTFDHSNKGKGVLCAGSSYRDIREGDNGGPLMMKASDGRWFQIGIASSWNNGTIEADPLPGVYTDVRENCEWIDETTKGEVKCQEKEVTLQDAEITL